MMDEVKFILTAMPDRAPVVEYLKTYIPGLVIVWDKSRCPRDTCYHAWETHQDVGTIRIEDDIILTVDFVRKALEVVASHPGDVIQFFSRGKKDRDLGSRWKSGGTFSMNQCYYMPPNSCQRLLEFARQWDGWSAGMGSYDVCMAAWMRSEKKRYWLHVPSLVEHMQLPSQISPRSKFRQMAKNNLRTYLFEYSHEGSIWQLEIPAVDMEDARARVRKFSLAKPVGELMVKLPSQANWFAKALCAIANFLR
jgi:hypothetical protein